MNTKCENTELLQCPYDKAHMVMRFRFQKHLLKCKKNHLDVIKEQCPFNVAHLLDPDALDDHVRTCPDRSSFERFRMESDQPETPNFPEMPRATLGETWDDSQAQSYNPRRYAAASQVLRSIEGAQPAERRKFREEEHRRLNEAD